MDASSSSSVYIVGCPNEQPHHIHNLDLNTNHKKEDEVELIIAVNPDEDHKIRKDSIDATTLNTDSDISLATTTAGADGGGISDSDNEVELDNSDYHNEEKYDDIVLDKLMNNQHPSLDYMTESIMTDRVYKNNRGESGIIKVAILGCGMMGQEHCSYIMGYSNQLRIDYLCDPNQPSIDQCLKVMKEFSSNEDDQLTHHEPMIISNEDELLHNYIYNIDLLVIATPNYLHTDTILRWGVYDHLTILCEKPVAVSYEQHNKLCMAKDALKANIWIGMEYRFIPAITKLIQLIPEIVGTIHMITIRENRYPFLNKVNQWNRNHYNTGDTLVEKCCHFFDLMRLITGQEVEYDHIKSIVQRGINYNDEDNNEDIDIPIIDSAYVILPFKKKESDIANNKKYQKTMGCLELCMFAEGSRHQEEIIVTGSNGRLEAYLPENKVYCYKRPNHKEWNNRNVPPPKNTINEMIYDCSNVKDIHNIHNSDDNNNMPTHSGYHYSSTAIEWYQLLDAMKQYQKTNVWEPLVSLDDGLKAVEIGLNATSHIV